MSTNTLKQLITLLAEQALSIVDQSSGPRVHNQRFSSWIKDEGGLEQLLKKYDVYPEDAYYWIREEEQSDEEFEKAAFEYAENELEDNFNRWQLNYSRFNYPITLYRCVETPDDEKSINWNSLGVHWSLTVEKAVCQWGKGGHEYVVTALVPEGAIDWALTVYHNVHPTLGDQEDEINLIEGSKIQVTELTPGEGTGGEEPTQVKFTATV